MAPAVENRVTPRVFDHSIDFPAPVRTTTSSLKSGAQPQADKVQGPLGIRIMPPSISALEEHFSQTLI
jgi:hypothetical protein